ncbi:TetR/AcrR family transcriptional regulator [Robbsia sp. Bb-Pol-6]|uniref:TetR/AcrR family transcriptional regulator n=1 Tax=Robbsia betulipollinis TaxID=2981849 RepID=A0ABT3ZGY1_9BURK|nr:TetR/AcrR family transcriptional regulator [Robbsia betulipollinis]MCY0385722.1 TetR/AcrR family transcriptional regulator [Robbsia betulipollinis]
MNPSTVREQLLAHAQTLLMARGYNGFSYRDLSGLVGVKTSSIHYHFPSKDQLALAAVEAYGTAVRDAVACIPDDVDADVQLRLFAQGTTQWRDGSEYICLCGMLAADIASLPESVRAAVRAFFEANEAWLAKVLARGRADGTLTVKGTPETSARTLMAAIQGSLLAARLFGAPARVDEVFASWMRA